MAARRAVPERTRRSARPALQAEASSRPNPTLERDDPAGTSEIARYLGNAYLETVARAAAGGGAATVAGQGCGPDALTGDGGTESFTPPARLQTKLAVGAAGDAFEREADRVADELMQRAAAGASAPAPGTDRSQTAEEPVRVSRHTNGSLEGSTILPPEIATQVERMRAGGVPLPARERALFEPLLGVDLGAIRIHTGVGAIQTASAMNARAYTLGSDVAFGSGQYRPSTDAGRRLLAHELVHTVQQRARGPAAAGTSSVQCKGGTGGSIVIEEIQKVRGKWSWGHLTVTHDLQWHWDLMGINAGNVECLELFIDVPSIARRGKPLSAIKVAAWSVFVLKEQAGIRFKDGTGQAFAAYVARDLERYGFNDAQDWVLHPYDLDTLLEYVEPQSLGELAARFRKNFSEGRRELLPLVAKHDYVGVTEESHKLEQERRREQWAESKEATIRKLIEQARKQKPRPRDLPDKVSARKGAKAWGLGIWPNYDPRRKKPPSHFVPLREGETDAELFERVRAATAEALFREADRDKREREKDFPAWAKAKKRAVEEALAEQRRRERDRENFPDGMVLVAERQAAGPPPSEGAPAAPSTVQLTRTSSEGARPVRVSQATVPVATGDAKSPSYIYLQVWVERGSGKGYQRNTGTVPLPLRPDTNVEDLVRYIRTLATILRQYERPPSGQPPAPAGNLERTLPSEQALRAFPALLAPTDLPQDGITVSGARNEFQMQLDYEDVYGGGEAKDIYIASKLFSQYIRFYWKVFKVPARMYAFKEPETAGSSPDWKVRFSYLYHALNATGQRYPDARWDNARNFGASVDAVWSDDDTDSKMRVEFPEMDETKDPPEDFIVYCETRHGPIGDEDLKRVSSIAYYPVHVKPIRTVAKAAVSNRTHKIKLIEDEIAAIRAQPKEELDATYQQVVRAVERIKVEELERLRTLETKKPAEGIQAEISYIDGLLPKLKDIQKEREEAERQKIAPSKLLEDRPELLAIHYWLLWEGKDLEEYTNEQKRNRERLAGSAKVAHTFKDDIKADSPHQYNVEAAMISTLTGLVYPLRLIIAEAPDSRKMFPGGIAYAVIDATSPETQDKYYGYSPKADSAGHRKAIQDALDDFGDDATYGEGLIIVRIPGPPPGQPGNAEAGSERTPNPTADAHPGPKFMDTESSPGPLQRVLWALSIIAFAAGAFALSLTGAGAPAAMALIGFIAAASGAVVAADNIAKRSRRHKLEPDAELALDIVSIVSVVPAAIGTKFALTEAALRRTNPAAVPAWMKTVERPQFLLRIHGKGEVGATLYLINRKLEDDIYKLELLAQRMKLNDVEKRKLRQQAFGNAIVSGVMMIGGVVAARAGAVVEPSPSSFVDDVRLQKQADLLELEGLPRGYPTLQDRNLLDAQGELTPAGRDLVDSAVPGASKRLLPAGGEAPTQRPPVTARPAAQAPRPAGAPETVAPRPPSRASAREAAETRARPVSRSAGAADVETAAQKGAPKRPRQKQEARAAEESDAGERAAEAEPGGGTFKGAPQKRPAKREPSRQERRQVSGKKPTGPVTGPPPIPLPAPQGVSLRSNQIWHHNRRDVVIVDTPNGPQAFYRRSGLGSLGEKPRGGAQKGDWAPFEGFHVGGQMAKPQDLGEEGLHRWGAEEQRQIAVWLKSLNLAKGQDVGDEWSLIQQSLEHAGIPVRVPQHGGQAVAPPTSPPEPPRAPPPGGGGGGVGGPAGVRPLDPVEAEYLGRPGPIWSSPHDYDRSMMFDHETYQAAWLAAAGPEAGAPPPFGYLDHNRREIVVYGPGVDAPVVPGTGPTRPSGPGSPGRLGGPDVTGGAPTRLSPAQAAQPARTEGESFQPAPRGDAASTPRPVPRSAPEVAPRVRDTVDPPGRIERSERADPDRYFAREHFGDVIRHDDGVEIPVARYFVEAEFKDGIIEMDFVLRSKDISGSEGVFRRSGQLRGRDEFRGALDHFRAIHGEAAIKGVKGEWGGGDNLDRFNQAFRERLRGNRDWNDVEQAIREGRIGAREWNEALEDAALQTKTGAWAHAEKFSEVEIQDHSGFNPNTVAFDRIVVVFRKPGASGSGIVGGPGPAPPTSQGPSGPASPGRPSSAADIGTVGAPAFARPTPSHTGPGGASRPPPAPQTPRGPSRPGGPPPAGPGRGGGGPRWPGVRELTAREAAGIRPEAGLARMRRGDWAISWITSRDLYQAAWRDAAGGQASPAPPNGFLDRDRRQIVVFKPPTNMNVIARPPARSRQGPPPPNRHILRRQQPQPQPRPAMTRGTPTRPYPAQAARDLPARPPSPQRRPPAPPSGGGGSGRGPGGASGVRPLIWFEARFLEKPGPIWFARGGYEPHIIFDHNSYRAAWRAAARAQGGAPPPYGYLDHNRRQIVVYGPRFNARVVPRPEPATTRPTRPYPAQAARDLPARPPPPPGRARTTRGVGDEVDRDRESTAPRSELEQSGRPPEPAPAPPARLPHAADLPEARGGLLDWLLRRRRLPQPQLGEQLSSGGDAGKLAYGNPGRFGVFEARLPDGRTVAVKIYPDTRGRGDADQRTRFARDMAALEAASRTFAGPRFHGEVNVGPRRRGFAMERIEGDFAEAQPRTDRELTDSERFAERLARARITERTLQDVERFGNELLAQGYYYDGEIQGLIDISGRYRPIDFEKVRPLSSDPQIRAEQTRNHQDRISNEIADLQSLRGPPEDRLPSDLPVPAALQGQGMQRFGTEVIGWGHGVQDTNDRLEAIRADPRGERARLEASGLTLDMAKAWHIAYQHLDGQRHTDIFAARTRLLAEIVKLMTR